MNIFEFTNEPITEDAFKKWISNYSYKSIDDAWNWLFTNKRVDWILQLVIFGGAFNDFELLLLACKFFRLVNTAGNRSAWNWLRDRRSQDAVDAVEKYCMGQITKKTMDEMAKSAEIASIESSQMHCNAWAGVGGFFDYNEKVSRAIGICAEFEAQATKVAYDLSIGDYARVFYQYINEQGYFSGKRLKMEATDQMLFFLKKFIGHKKDIHLMLCTANNLTTKSKEGTY